MRRLRHHAAGMLIILALAGAIAVHHAGVSLQDTHHDGMTAAIELCLGMFTAVGATVAALALGVLALARWRTPLAVGPAGAMRFAGPRRTPGPRGTSFPLAPLRLATLTG